jgi:hypothetical protein
MACTCDLGRESSIRAVPYGLFSGHMVVPDWHQRRWGLLETARYQTVSSRQKPRHERNTRGAAEAEYGPGEASGVVAG